MDDWFMTVILILNVATQLKKKTNKKKLCRAIKSEFEKIYWMTCLHTRTFIVTLVTVCSRDAAFKSSTDGSCVNVKRKDDYRE